MRFKYQQNIKAFDNRTSTKAQKGLGMMEVIITILILTVGLLGMVTLQLSSLKNANISNQRYLASSIAYDMSERIRANADAAASYVGEKAGYGQTVTDCSGGKCTVLQEDIYWWDAQMDKDKSGQVLPQATGSITQNGNLYRVTISWLELKSITDKDAAITDTSQTQTYFMEFQI